MSDGWDEGKAHIYKGHKDALYETLVTVGGKVILSTSPAPVHCLCGSGYAVRCGGRCTETSG